MDDKRTAEIIAGVGLLLFGLCTLFVGGLCTMVFLSVMLGALDRGDRSLDGVGVLLLSMGAAAVGLFAIARGAEMIRGRR